MHSQPYYVFGLVISPRKSEVTGCTVVADNFESAFEQGQLRLEARYPKSSVFIQSAQRLNLVPGTVATYH